MLVVFSVFYWVLALVACVFLTPLALIVWLVGVLTDKRLRALHYFTTLWAIILLRINPLWKLKVTNRKNFRKGVKYVVVCNHQSLVDILVVYQVFRFFKWVSKSENFKIPFVGWMLSLNKYIKIERGNAKSVIQMVKDCKDNLEMGNPVLLFPEGTRSETNEMRNFKDGAFVIAKEAKVAILPMVLHGTGNAIPKNGVKLKGKSKMRMNVLPEIPYEEFKDKSVEELKTMVFNIMDIELKRLQSNGK